MAAVCNTMVDRDPRSLRANLGTDFILLNSPADLIAAIGHISGFVQVDNKVQVEDYNILKEL